jgi:hypothetical protein
MHSVQDQPLPSHPYLAKHSELACTSIASPSQAFPAFVMADYAHGYIERLNTTATMIRTNAFLYAVEDYLYSFLTALR